MTTQTQRYIPLGVKRALRQEACFGCAVCGSPILEYHHIIPWAERQHNEPEHMVALCPTHHREYGKLSRSKSYSVKENPRNKVVGKLFGELGTDNQQTAFKVGSNTYIDTPIIFSFFEAPILRYLVEDKQVLVDVYIPRQDMWPDVYIRKNNMIVNTDEKWDVEFRTNYLKIQKRLGESYFELDLRGDIASISTSFVINGKNYRFSPTETNLGGGVIVQDSVFKGNKTGIATGDNKRRLLWPNFAMISPRALFVPI